MSRTMLVVAAVVLLVATLVAPAMAAPLVADDATPVLDGARTGLDGLPSGPAGPIQPAGDCENGGAGGCPVPG